MKTTVSPTFDGRDAYGVFGTGLHQGSWIVLAAIAKTAKPSCAKSMARIADHEEQEIVGEAMVAVPCVEARWVLPNGMV